MRRPAGESIRARLRIILTARKPFWRSCHGVFFDKHGQKMKEIPVGRIDIFPGSAYN